MFFSFNSDKSLKDHDNITMDENDEWIINMVCHAKLVINQSDINELSHIIYFAFFLVFKVCNCTV